MSENDSHHDPKLDASDAAGERFPVPPDRPESPPEPSPTLQVARGESAFDREDYESAVEVFSDLLSQEPGFADIRNKAGISLAMLGRSGEALEQLDAALRINPRYAEAHLNRAIVLNEMGRLEEAREAFLRASELDRGWLGDFPADLGNRLAMAHARLGDLYLEAERPARAAQEYGHALDLRPTFLDIRSRLAEALLQMGEAGKAGMELTKILEANGDFVSARVRLGVALQRMGDEDGARRQWEWALRQDPSNSRARAYLASLETGMAP
jgi:tetratricopeptide (TPR) repeat protein